MASVTGNYDVTQAVPIDKRTRVSALTDITNIVNPYVGMPFFVMATMKQYNVTALDANGKISGYTETGSASFILSGTYEEAVAASQSNNNKFMWLLIDTIGGVELKKPIWHVGNSVFVDAIGATIEK